MASRSRLIRQLTLGIGIVVTLGLFISACDSNSAMDGDEDPPPQDTTEPPEDTMDTSTDSTAALKSVFDREEDFLIGSALNPSQFQREDTGEVAIAEKHYNTFTPENTMKWGSLQPQQGEFTFDAADQFVQFAEENDAFIVGHVLVWHRQTPDWVFEDSDGNPVSRDTLLARMETHIKTVVNRYEDRIEAWDVVNEAILGDGSFRESRWYEIIGEDYIAKAFEFAREADPDAELYYNDFSLVNEDKRNGALELVDSLQAQNVPITGVGMQAHWQPDWPSADMVENTVQAFADRGIDVMISENDVDMLPEEGDPYPDGLPEEEQETLADRYETFFQTYLDNREAITRVTFWGVTDADSWLNDFPVEGRTNYPLLFGRDNEPKPAFDKVVDVGQNR